MSIFGDLDTTQVSDNPWETADGTYWAIVTESKMGDKDGHFYLTWKWSIDQPDSEYNGNNVSEYYSLFPGVAWEDMDASQKKAMKYLKRRFRRGFGFSEEEMQTVTADQLIGMGAFITVKNNEGEGKNAGRTFTNVTEAVTKELYEENKMDASAMASELGL